MGRTGLSRRIRGGGHRGAQTQFHGRVTVAAAKSRHFGATGGQHAAHAVKRYTFGGKDIAEVYTRKGVDKVR
jgi:hypothetical protein